MDASSGAALAPYAGIPTGPVYAAAPDGSGGWYIGGSFDSVDGVPRTNLAHIRADHTVSDWNPNPNGGVAAIAVSGPTVYVGGGFSSIGGGSRSSVWRQMVADITDSRVICPEIADAAALGAALQAAWCHLSRDGEPDLAALCERLVKLDEGSRADPDPTSVAAYREVYDRYRRALARRPC